MRTAFSLVFITLVLIRESIIYLLIFSLYYRKRNINRYNAGLKKLGKALCSTLPKIGPAFVKLGQFMSTRHDLISSVLCDELKNLQDRAPTVSFSKIERIIIRELGDQYHQIEIEPEPIAAASIAQVHKGSINFNGETIKVAIKVLRPNIRKHFMRNIEMMMSIASFINRFINPAERLRLEEVVSIIEKTANAELNLQTEAAAADKLRYNCRNQDGIYIPKVFWDFTTKSVLVTEWIDGYRVEEVREEIKHEVTRKLAFTFFHQAYVDGFFHADIHPGNILIDQMDRVVLLDFGMFSYLPEKDRLFLAEIIYAFVRKDYERASELHFKAGYVQTTDDEYQKNMFALACRSISEPIFGKSTAEISISKLLRRLFEVTSEFNMHTQPQLILLQKNMMSLEGVLNSLDPKANMWKLVEPWFTDWAKNNLNFKAKIYRKISDFIVLAEALEKKIMEDK
jgi:ubiquinone biosynthesis protein